jgi:hypothetical protein
MRKETQMSHERNEHAFIKAGQTTIIVEELR